jgi:hypothetical protein
VAVLKDKRVPWFETWEFRALNEVRRAFRSRGMLRRAVDAAESSVWDACFWALYEVGHILDVFEQRSRAGEAVRAVVRTLRHEDNRVVLEFAIEPAGDALMSSSPLNEAPDTLRSVRESDVHTISDVRLQRVDVG